jgi:hypothetical protein
VAEVGEEEAPLWVGRGLIVERLEVAGAEAPVGVGARREEGTGVPLGGRWLLGAREGAVEAVGLRCAGVVGVVVGVGVVQRRQDGEGVVRRQRDG